MEKIILVAGNVNRGIISLDTIDENGNIFKKPNLKERLLNSKKQNIEERYKDFFKQIDLFEETLEKRFETKMEENPFREIFIEELCLEIPYISGKEKEFILEYITKITPAAVENAKNNGVVLTIKAAANTEKKNIKVNLSYKIDLAMELDENLNLISVSSKNDFIFD